MNHEAVSFHTRLNTALKCSQSTIISLPSIRYSA